MPKRTDKVEVILPNGSTRKISESLVEDMVKYFGAVPASDKSFRHAPKELLTALKKVIVPVLDATENIPAEYPEPPVSTTEPEKVIKKTRNRK